MNLLKETNVPELILILHKLIPNINIGIGTLKANTITMLFAWNIIVFMQKKYGTNIFTFT